jgi:signal transduction histidine kinase
MMLRRLPIDSTRPVVVFAAVRVAVSALAVAATAALGFPLDGRATAVLGGLAVPWSIAILLLARRRPDAALSPLVAVGDIAVLVVLEIAAPETVQAVRATALFLVAAHAHFQGELRGMAVAALGSVVLVVATLLRGDEPISGDILAFDEVVFVLSALATGLVVGTLRTAESASRMRARGLSRRTIQAESEVRRRVAEAIHDGPVQDLIGLDMILSAARTAATEGRREEASALIEEAHELAERNIRILREDIVELGPYAFAELRFESAIENCLPVWKRRYGFEVMVAIERIELSPEVAGDLFRIAQEAVANAGRHAGADAVSISLRTVDSEVELRVTDNGHGFEESGPLASTEPGHLGLASIRERAELLDGRLEVETSERGTKVLVRAPMAERRA